MPSPPRRKGSTGILLTIAQVVALTGTSERTIRRDIASGIANIETMLVYRDERDRAGVQRSLTDIVARSLVETNVRAAR